MSNLNVSRISGVELLVSNSEQADQSDNHEDNDEDNANRWLEDEEDVEDEDNEIEGDDFFNEDDVAINVGNDDDSNGMPIHVTDTEHARRAISDILTLVFGSGAQRQVYRFSHSDRQRALQENSTKKYPSSDRLLYYSEEANVGRGFIKELCFNNDGRLIGSPFGFGVRLLAFDSNCSELCDVVSGSPMKLYELGTCISHVNNVVTCKFSPVHSLLVTGCLNGRIVFHQPVL